MLMAEFSGLMADFPWPAFSSDGDGRILWADGRNPLVRVPRVVMAEFSGPMAEFDWDRWQDFIG